ncbi:dermonecrotic toxin domain-containing protein [Pseudomonas rustica]|uniref:dermonecrotic toxin domain-containing protein n=1 Tax=Pseudomonas rustica TaxID=2827099 RepID=UPI001BB0848C|nr:DUF6543 domain-containing protein [Pseudomonas rustica]MBS4090547.1 hypothetical protein [Pseudomonas rustica]
MSTPMAMTLEQQGVFFEFFKKMQWPAWFVQSSPAQRKALYDGLIASFATRDEARTALEKLRDPNRFATEKLTKALSEKIKEPLDITGAVFQHVRSTSSLLGLRKKLVLPIARDLVVVACENFTSEETRAENYHARSLIYLPESVTGRSNRVLPLQPHELALLCRELDLGKQYQQHLEQILEKDPQTRKACVAHSRRSFEVDLQLALMKQHISPDTHQRLCEALQHGEAAGLSQAAFSLHTIKLLDCTIYGVMVLQLKTADKRCVLYLPGDPEQSIQEFSSFQKMEVRLSARLRQSTFHHYFARFVALGEQVEFRSQLKQRLLEPSGGSPLPKESIYLPVTAVDMEGDGLQGLFLQRLALVKSTARLLVVPTDDEDEKERLARLETYETVGIDLALFAASFVPGVGEILMAVTAFQLLRGVYLGIDSWARGDQEQATEYFFDTTENLILAAALAAGQLVISSAYRTIKATGVVARLREVKLSAGLTRLWNPDLAPYRQRVTLPDGLRTDQRGLRWLAGQAYLQLGAHVYAVRPQIDTEMWEVQPPSSLREDYAPLLETNDFGAWRHDCELPQAWDRLTLLRRLGYSESLLDDALIMDAMTASGVQDDELRQAILDRRRPPAALIDSVQRFDTDVQVRRFIEQLGALPTAVQADFELQLYLLTSLQRWPLHTALSITDATGQTLKSFAGAQSITRYITLRHDAFAKGHLYRDVLAALSESERSELLSTVSAEYGQQQALQQVMQEHAISTNYKLFEQLYQRNAPTLSRESALLLDMFSELPASFANELVWYADAHELLELEAGHVPLRQAEEARRYLQVIREIRAFEGLYLDAAATTDTNRLVLDALEHSPGWKDGLYVEILDGTRSDDVVAVLGSEEAPEHMQLLAHGYAYEVLNKQFEQVALLPGRTREHYFEALWQGLSAQRREALGVATVDGVTSLRHKITATALRRREVAHLTLSNSPVRSGYTSPMRLADRVQPESLSRAHVNDTPHSDAVALKQRAQELYPTHSNEQINAFLQSLGADEMLGLRKLEHLRVEFFNLRDILQRWIMRESWHQGLNGPRIKVTKLARFRAAIQIIRCWRRETPRIPMSQEILYELSLPELVLGQLPVLPADFSHVGALNIAHIGAGAGISQFLAGFTNVRELSLAGNELTRLPAAISGMTRLETLELNENRIHLTEESASQLARMSSLKRLELSFNSDLGRCPDVSRLPLLEHLGLRDTGISTWPTGTEGLPKLRTLDLRDNRIVEVPQNVLVSTDVLNQGTDIRGNPLSADSLTRLSAYERRNQINFGLLSLGQTDLVARVLVDESMSSIWLTGVTGPLMLTRQRLWRSVFLQPYSRRFFSLLIRLRYTVDYRLAFTTLRERVWGVITSAAEDAALRRALFRMADADARSIDDCSLQFSDLAVTVLCYRALNVARRGDVQLERQFLRLLRGLFRLRAVEMEAHKNIVARQLTETLTAEDARQVSFAFRLGLAQRLDLLGQPTAINERLDVEVTRQTLDLVYEQIIREEQSGALLESLKTHPIWVEYLERAYHEPFDAIDINAKLALLNLDRLTQLNREQLSVRMTAITENSANLRRALFTRLTQAALDRFAVLPAPIDVPTFAVIE